ncbi:S66 family peptidase [Halalkalibacter alkalisediminis]|uniref:S66 peptidase family protein n=1 Tax=Halalkalibacter alkalisediminis TaxID=935616 RepID=A0ABV6NGT1_9BACI|nr:S66 peptidase family protein [Halalkalibacter alkalisediminis]
MFPKKLQVGDEVRVISPSTSLAVVALDQREISIKRLESLGLNVTFSKNAEELDVFDSSSIESRIDDLHEAFADLNVKAILTTLGGYNSNQLLSSIDYQLIKKNPKILCGYSDITALSAAIYAKTGLVSYSGPHFSTFGMLKGFDYTFEYFKKCLFEDQAYKIESSKQWSDDHWYLDQNERVFEENKGLTVIYEGSAEGRLLGGNLCTLNLLQGTPYMPDLHESILFLEDDFDSSAVAFDRDLQSLLHLPQFRGVKGLVIGRFQRASNITEDQLRLIIHTKQELHSIPVVYNASFGHTSPIFTFPIGGLVQLHAKVNQSSIIIKEH